MKKEEVVGDQRRRWKARSKVGRGGPGTRGSEEYGGKERGMEFEDDEDDEQDEQKWRGNREEKRKRAKERECTAHNLCFVTRSDL